MGGRIARGAKRTFSRRMRAVAIYEYAPFQPHDDYDNPTTRKSEKGLRVDAGKRLQNKLHERTKYSSASVVRRRLESRIGRHTAPAVPVGSGDIGRTPFSFPSDKRPFRGEEPP
jgi:hypothetical protein